MKVNKASTKVFSKYANFAKVFSLKLAVKLPKLTGINNYIINLVNNKKLLYSLIYSLRLIKEEIQKTYMKNNLVHGFIRLFKSHTKTPILLDQKLDKNLTLYIDY